jgi:hypothetical protein
MSLSNISSDLDEDIVLSMEEFQHSSAVAKRAHGSGGSELEGSGLLLRGDRTGGPLGNAKLLYWEWMELESA